MDRWSLVLIGFLITGATGYWLGSRAEPEPHAKLEPSISEIEDDFLRISKEDLSEYAALKEQAEKYKKADLILAKVMKLFIADLGLRLAGPASCKLESGKINSEISAAAKTSIAQSLAKPEEISPPPAVYQPPPSTTTKTSTKSTQRNSPESAAALSRRGGPISAEKAKSAIDALYQAILWRAPDERGGAEAIKRMTEAGWSAYVSNAKKMVRSREFLQDVEPNHTPQQIINRIYAIYMGRCAFKPELERALNDLSSKGPGDVVGGIIQTARRRNAEQILSGGFSPSTCVE